MSRRRPQPPHSREPFLRLTRRLYRTDPSLRGFADFAVFGSVALLFVASPIPRQIETWFASKTAPAAGAQQPGPPPPAAPQKIAPQKIASIPGASSAGKVAPARAPAAPMPTLAAAVPVEFVGIGIRYVVQDSLLKVVSVLQGGPAEKAGLGVGTLISEIDGTSVAELDAEQVKNRIQGAPGSSVNLRLSTGAEVSVLRAPMDAAAFDAPRRPRPVSERWPVFGMPRRIIAPTVDLTDLQADLSLSPPAAHERLRQAFDLIHDPGRAYVAKGFVESLGTDYPEDANVLVLQGLVAQKLDGKLAEAIALYARAADRNHVVAAAYAGAMMVQPGPLQNLDNSFHYLKLAGDRGSNVAKFGYALRFYDNGLGGRADARKAGQIYLELVNAGYPFAWRRLGDFVAKGRGGFEIDQKKAVEYLAYGAQQGDADAMRELALFIASGIGTTSDPYWAAEIYDWLADRGDMKAANAVGVMYMDARHGIERDLAKGSAYIRRAALRNDPGALFNLGNEYRAGLGVTADPVQAYLYFLLADHYGNPAGKIEAEKVKDTLTPEQLARAETSFKALARRPKVPR